MAQSRGAFRAIHPEAFDRDGFLIPTIPCSACGRVLRYTEGAIVSLQGGGYGWGHALGACHPTDAATWQARLTRTY